MIHRAECACIVSSICISEPILKIVSTYANAARSFPRLCPSLASIARRTPSRKCQYPEPLVPVSSATLCAAPSAPRRASALCASNTRRPFFGPFASTTRRPPPSFCILRYDVVSSARPSSFQLPGRRFRYVSIHSYTLSAQPGKRDQCERLRKGNGQVLKMAWRFVAHG
jgi:hypothetical protein